MNTGLSTALTKIDDSIVTLLRERERLVGAIADEAAERSSISPFVVPFAVGNPLAIKPFEAFVPGMWIGYGPDNPPSVTILQREEADDLLSPPDHHFVLDIGIRNASLTPWITLEKALSPLRSPEAGRLAIALKAKASVPTTLRFELSIPVVDQDDLRLSLGSLNIETEFDSGILSQGVRLDGMVGVDPQAHPKLIAFLPTHADVQISLAYYTTLLSPR